MTETDFKDLPSASAVIAAFGGIRPMAARLDVPVSTVQGWKQREVIPENRYDEIRAAAGADGIDLSALPKESVREESDMDAVKPARAEAGAERKESPRALASEQTASGHPASGGGGGATAIAVIALIVAAAAAGWLWWSQQQPVTGNAGERLAKLEQEVAGLRRATAEIAALRAETRKLADRPVPESADAARLAVLDARIEQLARRLDSGAGAPVDTARLARLASDLDDVKAAASSSIAAVSGLKTGVDNVMGDVSARLNAIENRAGKADASEARAVGLAIAAAELRRTLRSGAPYGSNLAMLRELASGDAALAPHIAILEKSAASGLPTLSALSRRFSNLITDILAAGRERTDATWYEQALERASAIVSIRRIGSDAEGDSADAVIARTEARLADGDLAGVVAQAATLKGAAAVAATPWLADARALLAAEEAVAAINTEALATLAKARGG